jgi:colicin import membrane protein
MSTALAYQEPYRLTAGVLALMVHLVLFALLYFGVRWQSHPPEAFTVEVWEGLPNAEVVAEQPPAPPVKAEPAPLPKVVVPASPPVKADIEMREKKSRKTKVAEKPEKKDEKKERAAAKARQEAELEAYTKGLVERQRVLNEVRAEVRNEVSARTQAQVDRYRDLIINKIRRRRKEVADVPKDAEAIFKVTLLPDGMLMDDPVLIKSSGFPAYDEAAERAILAAEPLPVPDDVSLQQMFRELKLSIRP